MRGVNLTKKVVDSAEPVGGDATLWDREVPGFGLRVRASGARYYVFQYTQHGEKRKITIGRHGAPWTPDAARKEAKRLRGIVASNGDPATTRDAHRRAPTLKAFAATYLADHARPKKKSAAEDERLLEQTILPVLGRKRVAELTRSDLTRLHLSLKETPFLANRVLALLSKMLALAEAWGERVQGMNPARGVERFREPKRRRFLDADELVRVGTALKASEGEEPPAALAAIRFLLLTGMRLGEVLTLKWEYIVEARSCIALPDSKTGAKEVPIGQAALKLLTKIPKVAGNPHVFTGRLDGRHIVGVPHVWDRVRERAKVPDVRLHDLRHSYAAVAVGGGAALPIVGAILGHASPITTSRYAHLAASPLAVVADRTAREIESALGGKKIAAVRGAKKGKVVPIRGAHAKRA